MSTVKYPRRVAITVLAQMWLMAGGLVLAAAGWDFNVAVLIAIGLVAFAVAATGLIPGASASAGASRGSSGAARWSSGLSGPAER